MSRTISVDFGMIFRDRIRDRLQQHRLTGSRRSDDQCTLAFTDRRNEVDDAGCDLVGSDSISMFNCSSGIKRRQIVKENLSLATVQAPRS